VLVRRLVLEDRDAYRALALRGYTDHPESFTSSAAEREALPLSWWEQRLALDGSNEIIFGAFAQEADCAAFQLVGVAGLSLEPREKTRHKSSLIGMYICPEARGQKIGHQLVHAVLEQAKKTKDLRVVQLTVTEGNVAAQTLYERCGFETFAIEPLAVKFNGQYYAKRHMMIDLQTR
jgi:RimJ/RimL family protein N-acetyltransferase